MINRINLQINSRPGRGTETRSGAFKEVLVDVLISY
jgi:hypothetical protein